MKYYYLFIIIIFFGCSNTKQKVENVSVGMFPLKYSLEENGEIYLYPEDDASPISFCIQYIESSNQLAVTNPYRNSIVFHNLKNGEVERKLLFDVEGNNGVGKIDAFLYLNEDSVYVYSYKWNRLSLLDNQLELLKKYNVFDPQAVTKDFSPPAPAVSTNSPLFIYHDKLIMSGYLIGEKSDETFDNSPTTIILDRNSENIQYAHGYPEFYHKDNWGGSSTFRSISHLVHNDDIIASFPASHDLQIYSMKNGNYKYCYAGSNRIKEIKPFAATKAGCLENNDDDVFEWYMKSPSYEGIFYDKYRDVFYRIARLPIKGDYNPNIRYNPKPVVVIILDSQLNYVGETLLTDKYKYSPYNVFINEEGLNMQIRDEEGERMIFKTFKLKEYEDK